MIIPELSFSRARAPQGEGLLVMNRRMPDRDCAAKSVSVGVVTIIHKGTKSGSSHSVGA